LYNDLDDNSSNEPVKGGVKSSNQNPNVLIKTPMRLFAERKNGYLASLGSTLQKPTDVKSAQGSIKQSSIQENMSPIIYPSPDADVTADTEKSELDKKYPNGFKLKAKGPNPLITTKITTNKKSPPNLVESNPVENNSVDTSLDVKGVKFDKSPEPTTLNSLNVIDNLEIKEIKVDNVLSSDATVKLNPSADPSSDVSKVQNEPEIVKSVDIVSKEVIVNNQDSALIKEVNKDSEINSKPIIKEDSSLIVPSVLDLRKPVDQPLSVDSVVDVAPVVSPNTENSIIVESETRSSLVN